MTHDKATKAVLRLITLILDRYGCKVAKNGANWTCRFAGQTDVFEEQLDAVLHGCGLVIPTKGSLQ
jgi:hypothetical protein